jgi:hypothetical protein
MYRALKNVEGLPETQAQALLGINDTEKTASSDND